MSTLPDTNDTSQKVVVTKESVIPISPELTVHYD